MVEPSSITRMRSRHSLLIYTSILLLTLLAITPYILPPYHVQTVAMALILSIATLGLNMVFGQSGLLSFGHAAFFGLGGYSAALLYYYMGIREIGIFIAVGAVVSTLAAAAIGFIVVRYTKIYFAMLTLAFSMMIYALFVKLYNITRGDEGMYVPIASIFGLTPNMTREQYIVGPFYYVSLAVFLAILFFAWVIYNSPFGLALRAVRESSVRAEFLGINVIRYRWYAFTLSGLFGGVSGSLYAVLTGHVGPILLHWLTSAELVFMCILGGYGTFIGPVIGSLLFTYLKTYATTLTIYWQLALAVFLTIIIFGFPRGVVGTLSGVLRRGRRYPA